MKPRALRLAASRGRPHAIDPAHAERGAVRWPDDASAARRLHREMEELRAAKERAEAANRAKSRLLANMSHELRTPLNAVLGYAQLLQMNSAIAAAGGAAAVDIIRKSGEHLLALVNDVLDLSRIEAGRMELNTSVVDLPHFLQTVRDIMAECAQHKGIALVFDTAPHLPRRVRMDEHRLRQVLLNLLGNAVKFTDRGSVRMRTSGVLQGAAAVRLQFEVEDTGPGIAGEHLESIFLPFEQVGDAAHRADGTGLGLAIGRELVRAMGGEIHVRSLPGLGSVFSFDVTLPLALDEVLRPSAPVAQGDDYGRCRR